MLAEDIIKMVASIDLLTTILISDVVMKVVTIV